MLKNKDLICCQLLTKLLTNLRSNFNVQLPKSYVKIFMRNFNCLE